MAFSLALLGASTYEKPALGSYDLLSSTILTSNQASVTFASLENFAANYRHLQLRYVGRSTQANEFAGINLRFNYDTAGNYSSHFLKGDGVNVASSAFVNQTFIGVQQSEIPGASNEAGQFGAGIYDILDPFNNFKNTTTRMLGGRGAVNTGDKQMMLASGLWRNTSPITAIGLSTSALFVTGSRFSLYGLRKV